tara:strand:- start:6974 stop:7465 length:492 start_codon:yes stop_codon:yes gene_type:complete
VVPENGEHNMSEMMSIENLMDSTANPNALSEGQHLVTIKRASMNEATHSKHGKYQYLLLHLEDETGIEHGPLKINAGVTKLELAKFAALWSATMGKAPLSKASKVAGPSGLPAGKLECLKGKRVIANLLCIQDDPNASYTDSKGWKNEFAIHMAKSIPTFGSE